MEEENKKVDGRKKGSSSKNLAIARQRKIEQLKQAKQAKEIVKEYISSDSDSSDSDSSDDEPVIKISTKKKSKKSGQKGGGESDLKQEIEDLKNVIMNMNKKTKKKPQKVIQILPSKHTNPEPQIAKQPEKSQERKDLEHILTRRLLNF